MIEKRALPGENQVQPGAGAPPMCNPMRNWASGIPPSLIFGSIDASGIGINEE